MKKDTKEEQLTILKEFDIFDNGDIFKPLEIFEEKHFGTLLNKIKKEGYSEDLYQECSKDKLLHRDMFNHYSNNFRRRHMNPLYKSKDSTNEKIPYHKNLLIDLKPILINRNDIRTSFNKYYPTLVKDEKSNYINLMDLSTEDQSSKYATDRKESIGFDYGPTIEYNTIGSTIGMDDESDRNRRLSMIKVDFKTSPKDFLGNSVIDELKTLSPIGRRHDSVDLKDIDGAFRRKTIRKFSTVIRYMPDNKEIESQFSSQKFPIFDKSKFVINNKDPNLMKLFKKIAGQEKLTTSAIKFPREVLRNFYAKRYPYIIAEKLINVLEFPAVIDYKIYLDTFQNLINKNLYAVYFLAFKIYDINNDGFICHRDVFQIFKLRDNYPVLSRDFLKLNNFCGINPINTNFSSGGKKLIISKNERTNPNNNLGVNHPNISPTGQKKDKLNLSKIWYAKDEGQSIMTKLEYGNDIAQKYKSLYEMACGRSKHNSISITDKPVLPNILSPQPVDQSIRQYGTNENGDFTPFAKNTKADLTKFREIFDDDIPYFIYDLIFLSVCINLCHKPLLITFNDIMKLFENH